MIVKVNRGPNTIIFKIMKLPNTLTIHEANACVKVNLLENET